MWWLEFENGEFNFTDSFGGTRDWKPASPVGDAARKIALLQCVPPGTEVPGVGVRTYHTTIIMGPVYLLWLEDT